MTIQELINELNLVENKDVEISIIVNNGNPEDEDDDIIMNGIEIHGTDTENPTIFIY